MILSNRIAIVTGAGGGLGRAHALELARQGAKVVVNDLNPSMAEAVAEEILRGGGQALAIAASVTDEHAVGAMMDRVRAECGRIDILVNNAGILRDKTFTKGSLEDFRLILDVHLMGAVICTKAVWDGMRAQQYGRIVMTTSSSGLFGNFGQSNYAAAKMALVGLMQALALEGAKYNVRVNCLAPTAATGMTAGVLKEEDLARLAPELVSPGIVALVADDAPSRAILCAGAGHFSTAHITLSKGQWIGSGAGAAAGVIEQWSRIADRTADVVPAYGFFQAEQEVASATKLR